MFDQLQSSIVKCQPDIYQSLPQWTKCNTKTGHSELAVTLNSAKSNQRVTKDKKKIAVQLPDFNVSHNQ